jgi:hypothetical protein
LLIRFEEIQAESVLQATGREAEAIDVMSSCILHCRSRTENINWRENKNIPNVRKKMKKKPKNEKPKTIA